MSYLVFDDERVAFIANAVISQNMRLSGDKTQQWDDIKPTKEGKFALLKPDKVEYLEYLDALQVDGLIPDELPDDKNKLKELLDKVRDYTRGYAETDSVEVEGSEGI